MDFDFGALAPDIRYKLMTSTITPRPIAWVTTLSVSGVRNAAPYSFFNAMSKDPPIVALGVQAKADGGLKDTARNILDTGEFVVNLVPESAAQAMSATSIETAPDVDELLLANVATHPSHTVKPPRIALSPVSFECRLHTPIELQPGQLVILGQIVHAHIADAVLLDAERFYIDTPKMDLIGRMHGAGWYARTRDLFQIARPGA
jgi:flavin reductase (DIM6/NTAB) family NADH-FMN oxidoreductase RutF